MRMGYMIFDTCKVDYKQFVPRECGFIFKFIKSENSFIHTFIEGELLKKFGLIPEMVVGKTLFEFLPEQSAIEKHHFYDKAWNGETINYEGYLCDVYYIVTLSPIRMNSKTVEVIGTAIDFTKEKKRGIHIQQLEKLSAICGLAAGIAHEIRNPLTSIMGFTKIVREGVCKQEQDQYLDIVLDEIDRINSIIKQFIFIAKPHDFLNIKPTNINKLLNDCISFIREQSNMKSIIIDSSFLSEITINCDENQLKQMLINLLQNAIEATNECNQNIEVLLKIDDSTQMALIQISDKGRGISEERQKRLFEPFYSTNEKGTGLGLITCKRIIDLHEGKIEIKSKIGEGTTVRVYLPQKAGVHQGSLQSCELKI